MRSARLSLVLGLVGAALVCAASPATALADGPSPSIYSGGNLDFSPNGDGQEDTATVSYCLAEAANVTIAITDSSGTTVRTLADGVSEPAACGYSGDYLRWDGRDDSGVV